MMLWAVHISDGVLATPWWLGGLVVAGILLWISARRIRDEEIPRIALLTAVFFIVALIHVRVGMISVHLLMNGLMGIVLGPRAALAIFSGLFLQYWFVSHGGLQTLGVNTCVLAIPALATWLLFHASQRLPCLRQTFWRAGLVSASVAIWILGLVFCVSMLWDHARGSMKGLTGTELAAAWEATLDLAWIRMLHPLTLVVTAMAAALAAWMERRLENAPEFPLGLILGELAVLLSVGLNFLVLTMGMERPRWGPLDYLPARLLPLAVLVLHLPIAVFEGIVLGFTLGFLARVKPELIGMHTVAPAAPTPKIETPPPSTLPLPPTRETGIVRKN